MFLKLWVPQNRDIKLLGSVQRRPSKAVKGLEDKGCKEWLSSLGWFSPELRRLRGDLMVTYSFSQGEWRGSTKLYSLVLTTEPWGLAWSCIRRRPGGS